jgi:hypothetical protein
MAKNIQPKADQPRVTTENLKRGERSPELQYKVSSIKTFDRSPSTRTYGRTVRG